MPYQAGTLLFHRDAASDVLREWMRHATFPLLAPELHLQRRHGATRPLNWVLGKEKLTLEQLRIDEAPRSSSTSSTRSGRCSSARTSWCSARPRPDELNRRLPEGERRLHPAARRLRHPGGEAAVPLQLPRGHGGGDSRDPGHLRGAHRRPRASPCAPARSPAPRACPCVPLRPPLRSPPPPRAPRKKRDHKTELPRPKKERSRSREARPRCLRPRPPARAGPPGPPERGVSRPPTGQEGRPGGRTCGQPVETTEEIAAEESSHGEAIGLSPERIACRAHRRFRLESAGVLASRLMAAEPLTAVGGRRAPGAQGRSERLRRAGAPGAAAGVRAVPAAAAHRGRGAARWRRRRSSAPTRTSTATTSSRALRPLGADHRAQPLPRPAAPPRTKVRPRTSTTTPTSLPSCDASALEAGPSSARSASRSRRRWPPSPSTTARCSRSITCRSAPPRRSPR